MNDLERLTVERTRDSGFMHYNHMEMKSVDPDRAVFQMDVRPEHQNIYGMIHGGAIYTLADNASGAAAHTDGRHYVTQEGSLHFLRNVPSGMVYATATVRHRGRSTCLVNVDITAESGTLLAAGDFTFFCIGGGTAQG